MLTKLNLETLEKKLLAEKIEIENQLGHITDNLDFGSETDHLEEETDEAEEFANRLSVKKALEDRLNRVTAALEKMKGETYGVCERCKGEISFSLLFVDPESTLCKKCKTEGSR